MAGVAAHVRSIFEKYRNVEMETTLIASACQTVASMAAVECTLLYSCGLLAFCVQFSPALRLIFALSVCDDDSDSLAVLPEIINTITTYKKDLSVVSRCCHALSVMLRLCEEPRMFSLFS